MYSVIVSDEDRYGSKSYWDRIYGSPAASDAHDEVIDEWLEDLSLYEPILQELTDPETDRVLVTGCGLSSTAFRLVELGFAPNAVISVDYSEPVIQRMRRTAIERGQRELTFETMDCTDMRAFPDASFDIVLDKGTIDAMACAQDHNRIIARYVSEIRRLLRPGGRFILISLSPLMRDVFAPDGAFDVRAYDVLTNTALLGRGMSVPEIYNFLYIGWKKERAAMRIAILGTNEVSRTLEKKLRASGHEVTVGVSSATTPSATRTDPGAPHVTSPREAIEASDVVILAAPWSEVPDLIAAAGDFRGRPLLDTTNPIGADGELLLGRTTSGAEHIQALAPTARVVKVLNTASAQNVAAPAYAIARAIVFVASDDPEARAVSAQLARELGFEALELASLTKARLIEPLACLSAELGRALGPDVALHLLRRFVGAS